MKLNVLIPDLKDQQNISGINGYWTLSPYAADSNSAWYVNYHGYVLSSDVDHDLDYGVRPVINLKI